MSFEWRKFPRAFTYTKYPKVYEDSYWGSHRFINREGQQLSEKDLVLIENRNRFKEEYNLKSYYDLGSKVFYYNHLKKDCEVYEKEGSYDRRDHIEYYKDTNKNVIIIFSMWVGENQELINKILEKGYVMIEPLYATDQKTFMKKLYKSYSYKQYSVTKK
jgi:hypothetical protein